MPQISPHIQSNYGGYLDWYYHLRRRKILDEYSLIRFSGQNLTGTSIA